jgi:hypothetical protein
MGQWWKKQGWKWLVLIAVVALVAVIIVFGAQCAGGGGQFAQIGEQMQGELKSGRVPQSYKYVGDMQTMQYWPNKPEYEQRIPAQRQIWIIDDKALAGFKGWQAGPL